jgi:hypothetical protein
MRSWFSVSLRLVAAAQGYGCPTTRVARAAPGAAAPPGWAPRREWLDEVAQASVAQASVAQASVAQASVAQASVAQASVAQAAAP